jgi:hypothetical protein
MLRNLRASIASGSSPADIAAEVKALAVTSGGLAGEGGWSGNGHP